MKRIMFSMYLLLSLTTYGQISKDITLKEGTNNTRIHLKTSFGEIDVNSIIWLPKNFKPEKKYPLVVYGHDNRQAGDDINDLYAVGLPAVLKGGYQPGFDCIIICPQATSTNIQPSWLPAILDVAGKMFNIDAARIYLVGNSNGGYMCLGSQLNVSAQFAKKIAAICIISGSTKEINQSNFDWWIESRTPIWSIVGEKDASSVRENIFLVNGLNKKVEDIAQFSVRPGVGHEEWNTVYDGTFTENGRNIWNWLYSKTTGKNAAPVIHTPKKIYLHASDRQVYCSDVSDVYKTHPGDTLVVPTGIISFLLQNFSGTKSNPIVIVPRDSGWIGGYPSYSGNISRATFFKLSGFHIDGLNATNFGLAIGNESSDFEITNCHIKNIASIGLCALQNPDSLDPHKNWPDLILRNISIHDIEIKNTGTEAVYLGYTFDKAKPLAPPFENLSIYNINTDSSGWDGVQLSNCQNVSIHNITITNYGLKNLKGQQAGLLLGGMVTLKNPLNKVVVSNGTGPGMLILGRGKMYISNVSLNHVGTSKGENAIFVNDNLDLGYNLKPLQINMKNIKVNGSAGSAMMNMNSNKSMLPGTIEDFIYSGTNGGIVDNVNVIIRSGAKASPAK